MNLKDNRKDDHNAEAAFGQFLDENFYPTLIKEIGYDGFRRETNPLEQKNGCDVMLFDNSIEGKEPVRIDEKASVTYCNGRPLNTFLMELSCINSNGQEYDGWFLNKSSTTDMYALATNIRADFKSYGDITKDSFLSTSMMLIWKKDISEYLASRGLTEEALRNKVGQLRNHQTSWKWQNPNTGSYEWDLEFDLNDNLATKPVCIKLSNSLLYRLVEKRLFVRNRKCCPTADAPTVFKLDNVPHDQDSIISRLIDCMKYVVDENKKLKERVNNLEMHNMPVNSSIGSGSFQL